MPLYTDLFFILSFHNEAFIAHLFSIKAVCCVCVCVRADVHVASSQLFVLSMLSLLSVSHYEDTAAQDDVQCVF